ncbi:hypothetical protein Mpet_2280 [Methanolacinia petrolearia DSM 11571]|uniref:Uncharacterized protein n=1 Tax=Methanolacinia petrolearia (strain DSM 11571 / OCM 486 / SEBR 4847) TaxID=679926 RepID=E1RD45_METP4|nr:hypothetical protein Mpet_2280 [Methanolacinia petrolearia DSM 11571]
MRCRNKYRTVSFRGLCHPVPDLTEDEYTGRQDEKDRQAAGDQGQEGERSGYQIQYDSYDEQAKGQGYANSFIYHSL